jgi:hypothetical protein
MSAPTFTPIFSFPGTGANASPLPAGQFTSIGNQGPGGLPDFDQLQVLNAQITTTTEVEDDGQATAIATLPENQYVRGELAALLNDTASVFIYTRAGEFLDTAYALFVTGPFNDDTGDSTYGIFALDDAGGNIPFNWVVNDPITVKATDVITFAIEGSATGDGKLYFYLNDVLIFSGALNLNPDAALMNAGGRVGLQLDTESASPSPSDVGITNFEAGAFSSGTAGAGGSTIEAGYGTDISASSEVTTNPAGETNSNRTSIMGTNRGSRFIG